MATPDEIRDLIEINNRRLQERKKQLATFGLSADPSITLEIENIEAQLQTLRTELQNLLDGASAAGQSSAPAATAPTGQAVLVVEDDSTWQEILREYLVGFGCVVEMAATFAEARSKLKTGQFSLVTIDAHLSPNVQSSEGMLLLDYIRNRLGPDFPIIIVSGAINKRDLVRAFQQYAVKSVLLKDDFEFDEFQTAVEEALSAM